MRAGPAGSPQPAVGWPAPHSETLGVAWLVASVHLGAGLEGRGAAGSPKAGLAPRRGQPPSRPGHFRCHGFHLAIDGFRPT